MPKGKVPSEARGLDPPGARVTGSCEPPDLEADRCGSSSRAEHASTHQASLQAPQLILDTS